MSNKGGRPLKFKSKKELEKKIEAYFKNCDESKMPYTTTGLALWLDTTRHTLLDYEEKDKYSHTIKKAKLKIECYAENELFRHAGQVVGIIFNLKNNWEWVDKQEIDSTVKMKGRILLESDFVPPKNKDNKENGES